jgi:hypothetical protein
MGRETGAFGWYRFRTTFRAFWPTYLSLVLLIGLLGGLSMGSLAAARRTDSSFPVYFARTNPSQLSGVTAVLNPLLFHSDVGYDPKIIQAIAHLPHVTGVGSELTMNVAALQPNGAPVNAEVGAITGSLGGEFFSQDKVTVTEGKMANPDLAGEFMVTAAVAAALHLRVGEVLPVGVYTNAQTLLPDFGTPKVHPYRRMKAQLTGLAAFNRTVVQDDTDIPGDPAALVTPAFTRQFASCCTYNTESFVRVDRRSDVNDVASEIGRVLPKGFPPFLASSVLVDEAQRTIRPEAIALGVFGGIVGLAALLIGSQVIGRRVRVAAEEREVLRALGAGPAMTSTDGLFGISVALVAGSVLAVLVAVALSPIAPLGPVRPVYPNRGISFDWSVLCIGALVLVTVLEAVAFTAGYRGAPHRTSWLGPRGADRPSPLTGAAAAAGLPAPVAIGAGFALDPGRGRSSVPVRSVVLGTVLAIVVVVATFTFGASLSSLVSHPALYGWNWDYALSAGGLSTDIPGRQVDTLLAGDPYVAAWTGAYFGNMELDGRYEPVIATGPGPAVAPPILSGHGLDAADQVVLGAITLSQLHEKVGGIVVVSSTATQAVRLRIVGTATMPAIGPPGLQHTEMGIGALLSAQLLPAIARNPYNNPVPGPQGVLVRLRPGVNATKALRSLNRIAELTSNNANFGVSVMAVQRPAEIVNYGTMGATPAYLGAGLAAGAVAALALTLFTSVRRRRRDLAVLKTLGFTGRQLAATVAWQSTTSVGLGVIFGVPLGIALGRWLWDLFAHDINAVPAPSVPVLAVVLIAVSALVLANIVAALPGLLAARTPTALVLREE